MIYFVQRISDRAIKIGCTEQLNKRLANLRKEHGALLVLGLTDGLYEHEAHLHEQFKHLHIGHEWHRDDAELRSFIRLNCEGPDRVSQMDMVFPRTPNLVIPSEIAERAHTAQFLFEKALTMLAEASNMAIETWDEFRAWEERAQANWLFSDSLSLGYTHSAFSAQFTRWLLQGKIDCRELLSNPIEVTGDIASVLLGYSFNSRLRLWLEEIPHG